MRTASFCCAKGAACHPRRAGGGARSSASRPRNMPFCPRSLPPLPAPVPPPIRPAVPGARAAGDGRDDRRPWRPKACIRRAESPVQPAQPAHSAPTAPRPYPACPPARRRRIRRKAAAFGHAQPCRTGVAGCAAAADRPPAGSPGRGRRPIPPSPALFSPIRRAIRIGVRILRGAGRHGSAAAVAELRRCMSLSMLKPAAPITRIPCAATST